MFRNHSFQMTVLSVFVFIAISSESGLTSAKEPTNAAVRAAQKELEAAIDDAIAAYAAKLDLASKQAAAEGKLEEALAIKKQKEQMETHKLSTMPDPTSKAKRTLLAHTFRRSSGAILDFRSDYTAFGRHNGKTTNWVMPDPQTLIMGANDPTKPVYIWKLDKSLSKGTVYKYQPVTGEKRDAVWRVGQ